MEKVYTLGTSTRSLSEFTHILKHHSIKQIVDVRSFPQSSRYPHFNQENLRSAVKKENISYVYLGKELGGYRKGGYEAHMQTPPYQEGLRNLVKLGKSNQTALICAERFPWKCHRRFISQDLEARGFKVIHILEKEGIWTPKTSTR